MLLLMKAYKNFMKNKRVENEPEQIRRAFVSTFGKVEEYVDTFKNNFEFTDNENDFVESSIMIEWIKQNKLNISMTKLGRDIHKYCDQNKLKNVQSKLKKIGGKPKQVWFGIRILGEEEEEEEEEGEEEEDELDC